MPIIAKQSMDLLIDLINQSNPDLPVAVSADNVKFSAPTAVTPSGGTIQDTQIKLTALASGQFIGNTTLTYRRLNVATLFRSVPIVINKYSPAASNLSPYRISDLLGDINTKYGMSFAADDYVDLALPVGNTNAVPAIGLPAGTLNSSVTFSVPTTSYGYEGTFTLYWVQAAEDISNMISVTSLETTRSYPGNLGIVSSAKYVPDLDTYDVDFTNVLGVNGTIVPSTLASRTIDVTSLWTPLIAAINAASGKTYSNVASGATAMSLTGATVPSILNLTIASNLALAPEANAKYYNRALVINLAAGNTWAAVPSRMILHYND